MEICFYSTQQKLCVCGGGGGGGGGELGGGRILNFIYIIRNILHLAILDANTYRYVIDFIINIILNFIHSLTSETVIVNTRYL